MLPEHSAVCPQWAVIFSKTEKLQEGFCIPNTVYRQQWLCTLVKSVFNLQITSADALKLCLMRVCRDF